MKKLKFGIFGATRGLSFALNSLFEHPLAEVSAICDCSGELLHNVRSELDRKGIHPSYFTDFDDLLKSGIDALIIANYANDHARFAVRAMENGIHVLSECIPVQIPAEGVQLCEAVEKSGKIYQYAENYCFCEQTLEMRRRYRQGDIGEAAAIECSFINDCSGRWNLLTRGLRNHWRNHVPSTFYCTHSIGAMLYVTGLRPTMVSGIETPLLPYMKKHGARSGSAAMEIMKLENGAFARSMNGNLKHPYQLGIRLFGTKGSMEHELGNLHVFLENEDEKSFREENYAPSLRILDPERAAKTTFSLDRGTIFLLEAFIRSILGDREALQLGIDVYSALDMALPGYFAYRSILQGGIPLPVPDFRDPGIRENFRNEHSCTDPAVAGDALLPSCSSSDAPVPDAVYEKEAALYDDYLKHSFHLGFN